MLNNMELETLAQKLVSRQFSLEELRDRLLSGKIRVGNNVYQLYISGTTVSYEKDDIFLYLRKIEEYVVSELQKSSVVGNNHTIIRHNWKIPRNVRFSQWYMIVSTIWQPKYIIIDNIEYKLKTELPRVPVDVWCTYKYNHIAQRLYVKPYITIKTSTGDRFIHYHSLSEKDCSPEVILQGREAVQDDAIEVETQRIIASMKVINNDSLGRSEPEGLPTVSELQYHRNSKEEEVKATWVI